VTFQRRPWWSRCVPLAAVSWQPPWMVSGTTTEGPRLAQLRPGVAQLDIINGHVTCKHDKPRFELTRWLGVQSPVVIMTAQNLNTRLDDDAIVWFIGKTTQCLFLFRRTWGPSVFGPLQLLWRSVLLGLMPSNGPKFRPIMNQKQLMAGLFPGSQTKLLPLPRPTS